MRAKLDIGDVHGSARGIAQAIDGERLAALKLKPGLQREQDKQRHDIGRREVMGRMEPYVEIRAVQVAVPAPYVKGKPLRVAMMHDPACFDGRMGPSGRGFDLRHLVKARTGTQPGVDGDEISTYRVAELAGDKRAVSIARPRPHIGVRTDVAQPLAKLGIDGGGRIGRDPAKDGNDLGDHGGKMHPRLARSFEPGLEAVDVPGAQVRRAIDPITCRREVGEEVRQCVGICLDGRPHDDRPARRDQREQAVGKGEREATRAQGGEIDQQLAAIWGVDSEAQRSDLSPGIGTLRCTVLLKADLAPLPG